MPKQNTAPADYPQAALQQIEQLAQNIVIARKRRGESQAQWAKKLGISQPTMARIERGDPGVSMASYVMCMWLINQAQGLAELIAPQHDHAALEKEVSRVRAPRKLAAKAHGAQTTAQTATQSAAPKAQAQAQGQAQVKAGKEQEFNTAEQPAIGNLRAHNTPQARLQSEAEKASASGQAAHASSSSARAYPPARRQQAPHQQESQPGAMGAPTLQQHLADLSHAALAPPENHAAQTLQQQLAVLAGSAFARSGVPHSQSHSHSHSQGIAALLAKTAGKKND